MLTILRLDTSPSTLSDRGKRNLLAATANPPRGTLAHQSGGRSFPQQHSTAPLPADLQNLPIAVPDEHEDTEDDFRSQLRAEIRAAKRLNKQKKQDEAALVKRCLQHSKDTTPALLTSSRTLTNLGRWDVVPGLCDACVHMSDARDFCNGAAGSLSVLGEGWHERHRGIFSDGGAKRMTGLRGSLCWQAGTCHCSKTPGGTLLKKLWQEMRKSLRRIFANKTLQDALMAGLCAIVFTGVSRGSDPAVSHRCVFVALQYLKPWRPTFLEVTPFSDDDTLTLLKLFPTLPENLNADEALTMTVVADEQDGPLYLSALQFLKTLDAMKDWRMRVAWLADSEAPFVNSVGKFRMVVRARDSDVTWWTDTTRHGSGDEDLLDILDAGLDLHNAHPARGSGQDEQHSEQAADHVEHEDDDCEDDIHDLQNLDASLLSLWDSIAEEKIDTTNEVHTTSAGARDTNKADSSDSSSSSSTTSSSKKSTTLKTRPSGITRDTTKTEEYGMHILTPRYTGGRISGYQMRCNFPDHVKCTKELANSVTGSSQATRRVLKAWCLLANLYSDRKNHMSVKTDLLNALHSGTLLSESALDEITMATQDAEFQAPFQHVPPQEVGARRGGQGSLLGQRSPNVPEELHRQMEEWCAEGRIPRSTLAQRERQRIVSNTRYNIPQPLAAALRHGYISPNLPPPQGMVWVCHASSWRLRPRGG